MQRGDFDNLPGAGKPIQWKDNPLAPEDEKLAFDVLQNNGFTLPWIEKGREVKAERLAFRQTLAQWRRAHPAAAADQVPADIADRLARLNKMIMDYNRGVPVEALQVSFVDLNRELDALRGKDPELQ